MRRETRLLDSVTPAGELRVQPPVEPHGARGGAGRVDRVGVHPRPVPVDHEVGKQEDVGRGSASCSALSSGVNVAVRCIQACQIARPCQAMLPQLLYPAWACSSMPSHVHNLAITIIDGHSASHPSARRAYMMFYTSQNVCREAGAARSPGTHDSRVNWAAERTHRQVGRRSRLTASRLRRAPGARSGSKCARTGRSGSPAAAGRPPVTRARRERGSHRPER